MACERTYSESWLSIQQTRTAQNENSRLPAGYTIAGMFTTTENQLVAETQATQVGNRIVYGQGQEQQNTVLGYDWNLLHLTISHSKQIETTVYY